jgi:esterase/lipase superfamily enzyme
MKPDALVAALAAAWHSIVALAGDRRDAFEDKLLRALRALEQKPADTQASARVLAVLNEVPGAYQLLVNQLAGRLPAPTKGAAVAVPAAAVRRCVRVPVYYATDRARAGDTYSSARGSLDFGRVDVSVPDDRKMGELPKPRWWRLEFRPDPEKHVILLGVTPLSRDAWKQEAQSTEALIFVHGYNVGFEDAALRAAQFAVDLNFKGSAMLYSWPSEGKTLCYTVDEGNAIWTVDDFEEFLRLVLTEVGFSRVHLVAHSMGNRVVTEGLRRLDPSTLPAGSAELVETVFAAPDVDAETFRKFAAKFHRRPRRMTLYASSHDKALALSQSLHKYPRAGDAGDGLVIAEGLDTIDASAVDTSFLGHSYVGDNRSILSDIFYLVRGAAERHALTPAVGPDGGKYWIMKG